MASMDERIAAVEHRLGVVESLRSMTDADLGTVAAAAQSTRDVVAAMAGVQADQTRILGEHTDALTRIIGALDRIEARLDNDAEA